MAKKLLPLYTANILPYRDRIEAWCRCNLCGSSFTITLPGNPDAILHLTEDYIANRVFQVADRKHSCPDLKVDPKLNDRIVNKYHEGKERMKKRGIFENAKDYSKTIGTRYSGLYGANGKPLTSTH